VVEPAPSPRFSRSAAPLPPPARPPGADTLAALTEWGLADAADLVAAGAAVQAEST
jgi:alpha-methylacyl-CoA racemase